MTDDYQQCGTQHVVSGVKVTCHRIVRHDGPHSSSTYGTRWRDSGEVLPPPAPRTTRHATCDEDDCTLWPKHAGPHGSQGVLP